METRILEVQVLLPTPLYGRGGGIGIRAGQVNTSLHIFKEHYMDLYETEVGVDIGEADISIYVDGQKVLQIDQVSDNKVINLFLTPVGTARFIDQGVCCNCNLIFNGDTKDTAMLELLADRKQKQI